MLKVNIVGKHRINPSLGYSGLWSGDVIITAIIPPIGVAYNTQVMQEIDILSDCWDSSEYREELLASYWVEFKYVDDRYSPDDRYLLPIDAFNENIEEV